ncbi:CHAT domain-containing protein [Mangrovibacterium diazotrophicum]|uniref:CHAT domain-containing protein n=1 Tax=Mangrovibacterium diazotrophicum TaxID=1261403 RepID=A0A419W3H6_9BACT|nr:CHAT domain-containing protein [Mangrovibacterium diazotrophicum]RKD90027.1 CHAT domain-containing protein [Mangrovibacterium diazotrophicum]
MKYINAKQLILLLFGIYLYLNLATLLWAIISPVGFVSLIWYVTLLHTIVVSIFVVWDFIDSLFMANRIGRSFSLPISLILTILFASIVYVGPFLLFSWKMQDRYTLIKRSEKLFKKGEHSKSIDLAQRDYDKCLSISYNISPFFYFAYRFENSELNDYRKNNALYQATVNLALCLQAKGLELDRAAQLFNEAIELSHSKFNNEKEYLVFPLIGRFNIFMAQGKSNEVEKCYSKVSNIFSDLDENDIFYKTQALILYAKFLGNRGDIAKAMLIRKEALETYEKQPRSSSEHALLLMNFAKDLISINQLDEAESKLNACEELLDGKENQIIYYNFLTTKAILFESKGQEHAAKEILLKVYSSLRDIPGVSDLNLISASEQLARYYLKSREFNKASSIYNDLLKQSEKMEITPNEYTQIVFRAALADYQAGDKLNAERKAENILSLFDKFYFDEFLLLPANEKENLIAFWENKLEFMNFMLVNDPSPKSIERLYDNVLKTKSLALESNRSMLRYISDHPSLREKYNSLVKAKAEIDQFNFSPTTLHMRDFAKIDSIRGVESILINEIVSSQDFKEHKRAVKWTDIRNMLSQGQVAIEFINLPADLTSRDDRQYSALIIGAGFDSPKIIPLTSESEILKCLVPSNNEYPSAEERVDAAYSMNKERLCNLIWNPIRNYTNKCDTVYISLSGILHQISFAALTLDETNSIQILTSTRNIASKIDAKPNDITRKTAVIYGNIDYDSLSHPPDFVNNKTRYSRIIGDLNPLPGTKVEIDKVDSILNKNGYNTVCLERSDATEESFRTINKKAPKILHIATHGYYQSQEHLNWQYENSDDRFVDLAENPLFRSGLFFAGANRSASYSPEHDGFIDAYDISLLDLSGMDLLVLSACESGLGDIKGGEGVFGLQRAFKLAGVNDILVSLWQVPDKETAILMNLFYRYHFQEHLSKSLALKKAQRYLRDNINEKPFYWGAFQLIE